MSPVESSGETGERPRRIGPLQLFLAFSQISLSGFGGTLFWSRHVLVERRRWMTEREYVEMLAVGQLLPGPNVLNLTFMIGKQFGGYTGTAAAVAGFMSWPFLIVIGMGVLYQAYGTLPLVQQALTGMSAVVAGLLFSNGLRMTSVLPRRWRPWALVVTAFAAVGLMRWPLAAVLGVLGPLALLAAWKEHG